MYKKALSLLLTGALVVGLLAVNISPKFSYAETISNERVATPSSAVKHDDKTESSDEDEADIASDSDASRKEHDENNITAATDSNAAIATNSNAEQNVLIFDNVIKEISLLKQDDYSIISKENSIYSDENLILRFEYKLKSSVKKDLSEGKDIVYKYQLPDEVLNLMGNYDNIIGETFTDSPSSETLGYVGEFCDGGYVRLTILSTDSFDDLEQFIDIPMVIDTDRENIPEKIVFQLENSKRIAVYIYIQSGIEYVETIDNIKIRIYAPGDVLPENAEVKISKVETVKENAIQDIVQEKIGTQDNHLENIVAFDITFFSDGKEIQPNSQGVQVTFELPDVLKSTEESKVFHLSEEGDVELIPSKCDDEQNIVFEAEHFSVYGVMLRSARELIQVRTIDDLKQIGSKPNVDYILMNDLDLSEAGYWTPIYHTSSVFDYEGIFDGNDYTISGMTFLIDSEQSRFGLFDYFQGTIQNLTIKDVTIDDAGGVIDNYSAQVGIFACDLSGGTIRNCINESNFDYNGENKLELGGLVHKSTGVIENSVNLGSINGNIVFAGGICVESSGRIQNCINKGDIKINGLSGGGIAARYGYRIFESANLGSISAAGNAAGITGESVQIQQCYNTGNIYAQGIVENWVNAGSVGSDRSAKYAVGICFIADTVEQSYNSGQVTFSCDTGVLGGYRYENRGFYSVGVCALLNKVENCFNSGTINLAVNYDTMDDAGSSSYTAYAGGISCYPETTHNIGLYREIRNVYNIGEIGGTVNGGADNEIPLYLGGILSYKEGGRFENVYNINKVSGIGNVEDSLDVKQLSYPEMRLENSYAGFDFESIWMVEEGVYPYAVLQNMPTPNDVIEEGYLNKDSVYVSVMNESGTSGIYCAEIYVDGNIYETDESGVALIPAIGNSAEIEIVANGYQEQIVVKNLEQTRCFNVYLRRAVDGEPYITMATEINEYTNLLSEELKYAEGDTKACCLEIRGNWGEHGEGRYVLYQNGINGESSPLYISFEQNRVIFCPGVTFRYGEPIYAKMISGDGTESAPVKLKMQIYQKLQNETGIDDFKIGLGGKGDYDDSDNRNPFTGTFEARPIDLPIHVEVERDNQGIITTKVLIGFNEANVKVKDNIDMDYTTFVKEVDRFIKNPQRFQMPLLPNGKQFELGTLTKGLSVKGEGIGYYEQKMNAEGELISSGGGLILSANGRISVIKPSPWGYTELGVNAKLKNSSKLILDNENKWEYDGTMTITPAIIAGFGAGMKDVLCVSGEGSVGVDIELIPDSKGKIVASCKIEVDYLVGDMSYSLGREIELWGYEQASLSALSMPYTIQNEAEQIVTEIWKAGDSLIKVYSISENNSNYDLVYQTYRNGTWSEPKEIWHDEGTQNVKPQFVSDGSHAYVVWQKVRKGEDGLSVSSDIAYSEYDSAEGVFKNSKYINESQELKYSPVIALSQRGLCAAWIIEDGVNNCIMKSEYINGTWQVPEKIYTTEKSVKSLAIGEVNGQWTYAVEQLDAETEVDTEIYILENQQEIQITNNEIEEGKICFHNGKLYWNANGGLYRYDFNDNKIKNIITEDNAVTSQYWFLNELEDDAAWNFKDENGNILMFSPNIDGKQRKFIDITDETKLYSTINDIELVNLACYDNNRRNGQQEILYTVKNNGTQPVSEFTLTISDANNGTISQAVSCDIYPGESQKFTYNYNADYDDETEVKVSLDIDGDMNPDNNYITERLGLSDLELNVNTEELDGTYVINYSIGANSGIFEEVSLNIIEDNEDGNVIYSESIQGINRDTDYVGTYRISKNNINGIKSYIVKVESSQEEYDARNNVKIVQFVNYTTSEPSTDEAQEVVIVPIQSVEIADNEITLEANGISQYQAEANITPNNASYPFIEWFSDDETIAQVTDTGLIIPVSEGTTYVTAKAKAGDAEDQIRVDVKKGETYQLTIESGTGSGVYAVGTEVEIHADTPGEGSVFYKWSSNGLADIENLYDENTVIKIPDDNVTVTANYTEKQIPNKLIKEINLSKNTLELEIGQSESLILHVVPESAGTDNILWKSSNEQIAAVDANGVVRGISSGAADIIAYATDGSGCTAVCKVNVKGVNPVDKHLLNEEINNIKTLNAFDYSSDSYQKLLGVLSQAERILKDSGADQAAVDDILNSLMQAKVELIQVKALKEIINKFELLIPQSSKYTEDSWNKAQAWFMQANYILQKVNCTQDEVDNAALQLSEFIKKLEVKPGDDNEPDNNSYDGTSEDSEGLSSVSVNSYIPNIITIDPVLTSGTWVNEANNWRLLKDDGTFAHSQWALLNGRWYVFDNNGYMISGMSRINNVQYYFNKDGSMASGWVLYVNLWYYFDPITGAMKTGWIKLEDKWYYLKEDGVLLVNTRTPDDYYVNDKGEWVQ